jgi:hypothetical protein
MTVITMMTIGGIAEMHDGVRDKFKAPLKMAEVEFSPSGVAASPPSGSGLSGGGGGVRTPTTGLDNHRNPDGEKIEEGIEGWEDRCTHTRDFERALYVVQIGPPMLPRGQQREGVD